jgi:hypothetical protein
MAAATWSLREGTDGLYLVQHGAVLSEANDGHQQADEHHQARGIRRRASSCLARTWRPRKPIPANASEVRM